MALSKINIRSFGIGIGIFLILLISLLICRSYVQNAQDSINQGTINRIEVLRKVNADTIAKICAGLEGAAKAQCTTTSQSAMDAGIDSAENTAALNTLALWLKIGVFLAFAVLGAALITMRNSWSKYRATLAMQARAEQQARDIRIQQSAHVAAVASVVHKGDKLLGLEILGENTGLSAALRCQCCVDVYDHMPPSPPEERRYVHSRNINMAEKSSFVFLDILNDPFVKVSQLEKYLVIGRIKYATIFGDWAESHFCFGFEEGDIAGRLIAVDRLPDNWG